VIGWLFSNVAQPEEIVQEIGVFEIKQRKNFELRTRQKEIKKSF
jgi:hypothetical protein